MSSPPRNLYVLTPSLPTLRSADLTRPPYRTCSVSVQSQHVGPLRNGQLPCFSGAHPVWTRLRLPASTPMSSSVVAIESFQRLRKPNSATTPVIRSEEHTTELQ